MYYTNLETQGYQMTGLRLTGLRPLDYPCAYF